MNKNFLWQFAVFALVLIALNFFFQTYISIIGSLLLTVGLSILFNFVQQVDSISWGFLSMARLQTRR